MAVRPRARRAMTATTATYDRAVLWTEHLMDRVPAARRTVTELARVELINRAMILAAQALLALTPLLIVLSAFLPRSLAAGMVTRLQLTVGMAGSGTSSLREVLAAPEQQVRTQAGVIGLLIALASAVSFARALQAMFEKVWEQPRATGLTARRRCFLWLVGWLVYLVLVAATARALGLGADWAPGRLLAQLAVGLALWLWTAHTLLLGRVPWSMLWVGAVLTSVGATVITEASRVVMPRYIASNVAQFGPLGLVFALASWLIAFASMVVVSAVVGRVIVEDPLMGRTLSTTVTSFRLGLRGRRRRSGPGERPGPVDGTAQR